MTRYALLTRLANLLPAQFDEVLFRLGIPLSVLSGPSAPQTTRATEVLRYLENMHELARLEALLGPGPGASPAAPPGRPAAQPTAPAAQPGKHTILFLAANPSGTNHLALDREARSIQVELERAGHRDRFEFVTRWAVEPLDLLRELRKLKPTVVHFTGHGGPRGLCFQNERGEPQLVAADALKDTFGAAGGSVRVVVLSACYSIGQAEALLGHVDCVVGVAETILQPAAQAFAIGFYGGLGERESVAAAHAQGCAAISLAGSAGGVRPVLRIRPGVDAGTLVLAADPS